jgi:hypothetical protein
VYPQQVKAKAGEAVDVWIASEYLTLSHAFKDDRIMWGTHVYTDDSDIVKGK